MRRTAIAISLALTLAAPAQAATPLCTALETMVKAAMEPVEFASIRGKPIKGMAGHFASTLILPGFTSCEITPIIHDFGCYVSKLTADKAAALEASLKSDIESCMGGKMVRDTDFPLNPWALRELPGSYPFVHLLKLGNDAISFTFRFKGLRD